MSFPRYPAYKPSGVEWLGEVPEHWEVLPIKRIASLQSGTGITADSITDEGPFPVYGGNGVRGYTDANTHEGHFPIIGRQGALCGNINYAKGGFWASEHAVVVTPCKQVEVHWLGETLRAMNLNQYSVSAAQPGLSVEAIVNLFIPWPPRDEQRTISTFLDHETAKIDALIAEQQRLIELLQEKRQAVISHAVTKGLNPDAPMKDSGVEWLGEVPEHWEVMPCRAFFNERDERNGDYRSDYYLSLVAGRGVIPYDEKGDIGNKKPEDLGKCKHVREGDFVINSMNYGIGSYGVSRYDGVCSPVYIVVTPIAARTRPGFAFRVLENRWFQQYAQSFGNGILAHRCAIGWDVLKNINAGLPPENEQLDILRYLDEQTSRFENLIAEAEKQVNLLKERRSALISAAVTGQIDVRGLVPETSAA